MDTLGRMMAEAKAGMDSVQDAGRQYVIGQDGRSYLVVGPDTVTQAYFPIELPPEAAALLASFPARLTEAERRIDRVLARLGVD
jgi:hypothetical protein